MSGQTVAHLHTGRLSAGQYRWRWDARDDDGSSVASGVYLLQLQVNEQQWTRKLMLLR